MSIIYASYRKDEKSYDYNFGNALGHKVHKIN